MSLEIAALIVSLPNRHVLLDEAVKSVYHQTRQPDHLLIGVDYAGEQGGVGEVANMNRLIDAALDSASVIDDDLILAFLHDDDIWAPLHLQRAVDLLEQGHEVAVARCTTTGGRPPLVRRCADEVRARGGDPRVDFSDLMRDNWFAPSMVVARASAFDHWTPATAPPADALPGSGVWVDWSNWRRLQEAGVSFVDTEANTVFYRFGPWNEGRSWSSPS